MGALLLAIPVRKRYPAQPKAEPQPGRDLGACKGIAEDDLERCQKRLGGDTVQVDAERGDLICHHAFVIHRSAANRTPDRNRRSLGGAIVSTVPWPVPEWTNAEPRL